MTLAEDEILAFVHILNERPPSIMARLTALSGQLPLGVPLRPDVCRALRTLCEDLNIDPEAP